jgi:hypothetical protein
MSMKPRLALLGAIVAMLAAAGHAAEEAAKPAKSQCSVRSAEGSIRVLICPPGLEQQAYRDAGQEACGDQVKCNAWIWDSADRVPKYVPKQDSDIDPKVASEAVAVWANDSKQLMLIRHASKK